MAAVKQLEDIVECPICTEVYTDPRVLPCVHTFCLKCIEAWSKDKQPGDELACPLCRKELSVPCNGVGDLPKNFFIAKFLQMKELSSVESKTSPCEVCCHDDENEFEVQNEASVYCVECQMKLCKNCERMHKIIKATSSHKIIKLGEIDPQRLCLLMPPMNCDIHKDKNIEIYCFDCKLPLCIMCYIKTHNLHRCSDVNEVVDDFRKQMTCDVDNIAAEVDKCREILDSLEKEKSVFVEQVEKTGVKISEKAEQLKQMIDVHKEKLISELSSMKQKRMKEIESVREETERQLLSMESYMKYVNEVRQKGTACDIARAASSLHDRAGELLMLEVTERTLAELGHADVKFVQSDFAINDVNKTLGRLRLDIIKLADRSLNLHTVSLTRVVPSEGVARCSLASLGDEVFVACKSSQQIEVYDAETFTLQRRLTVPELGEVVHGLAADVSFNCLYASDNPGNNVHRVELSEGAVGEVKTWSVASQPSGLSVNKAHNVVVACRGVNKLQEYTTHGILVRQILLEQADVFAPWHAIQLSTGNYVVSESVSSGRISIVGEDRHCCLEICGSVLSGMYSVIERGRRICSYDRSQSDVGAMQYPRSLAVTNNDDILVADDINNRILLINSSLNSAQELTLPVDGGLRRPWGLFLDESRGRVYVSEYTGNLLTGCRVLVFESTAAN